MQDFRPDPRAQARDQALARLRRVTRFSIFGATALAGAFAGVAAHSSPGHKARSAAASASRRRVAKAAVRPRPTVTTQAQTTEEAPTPAPAPPPPPAPAPVSTSVAPVATTGTS